MPDPILIFLSIAIFFVYAFLLFWVYKDTQALGINSWPWMLAVFLTFGNFIGLVVYFFFRQSYIKKNRENVCIHCKALIPSYSKYCFNCGTENVLKLKAPRKRVSVLPLVIGSIILFITLVFSFGYTFYFSRGDKNYRMGSVQTKWGNTWNHSFRYLKGEEEHTFKVKNDGDILIYSSEITDGTIAFELYSDNKQMESLPTNTSDTIRDLKKDKKYKIIAKADRAKGKFDFRLINMTPP